MRSPDLSVVIVSHNHEAYLRTCLLALDPDRQATTLEVFVVDNASTDGSVRLVRAEFPHVRILENEHRQGYAANNNRALRLSRGRYALILNPDTETLPGALEALVTFADARPRVGLCGPQLLFPNGTPQPSCRRFPTLGSVLARRTPLRRWLWRSALNARHLMRDFDHTRTRPVDWMLGACLLARREFLQQVGLMDAGYFLYVEDIDWCYRSWQAGWKVMYYPEARIAHHHLAVSDRKFFSVYSWWHMQSMWRYYRKHLAPPWLRLNVVEERLS